MKYIEKNFKGFNLNIAKTGVKYLHSKLRNYDIAIYFEANFLEQYIIMIY